MDVRQMLLARRPEGEGPGTVLARCIEEALSCAQACTACADACLAEPALAGLRGCIRANLDCANICSTAGLIATRQTGGNLTLVIEVLNACALACRLCGDECERHAGKRDYCRICALACRRCEEACGEAIAALREGW